MDGSTESKMKVFINQNSIHFWSGTQFDMEIQSRDLLVNFDLASENGKLWNSYKQIELTKLMIVHCLTVIKMIDLLDLICLDLNNLKLFKDLNGRPVVNFSDFDFPHENG